MKKIMSSQHKKVTFVTLLLGKQAFPAGKMSIFSAPMSFTLEFILDQ